MEKQTHREPTLYIVGNEKRCNEIKNIIENWWGGRNVNGFSYKADKDAYYVNVLGDVWAISIEVAKKATIKGWMKEYKLPAKEKCEFKPFDKVVVRSDKDEWYAELFSHVATDDDGDEYFAVIGEFCVNECLPYNDDTAKLIGTNDDFDYDLIAKKISEV